MRLTIEIPGLTVEDVRPDEVILLLKDALSDFSRARHGQSYQTPGAARRSAESYVSDRYSGQSEAFRKRKIEQVVERFYLADVIKLAINDMKVE